MSYCLAPICLSSSHLPLYSLLLSHSFSNFFFFSFFWRDFFVSFFRLLSQPEVQHFVCLLILCVCDIIVFWFNCLDFQWQFPAWKEQEKTKRETWKTMKWLQNQDLVPARALANQCSVINLAFTHRHTLKREKCTKMLDRFFSRSFWNCNTIQKRERCREESSKKRLLLEF